jgi:hypothetical protein
VLLPAQGYFQIDAKGCDTWVQQNSVTHPVLRDPAKPNPSISSVLNLKLQDLMVLDRQLKIAFRGHVTDALGQNQVLTILGNLK